MKNIDYKKIQNTLNKIFQAAKVPKDLSNIVVDGLIYASLRGIDSHGIRLISHYIKGVQLGRINITPKIKFKKTGPSTGIVDADHTFGIVAGVVAMNKAIDLAKKQGIAIVTVKNSTHFGAAGIFSTLAAKKGMIGLSFTHSDSFVVPFNGKTAFLGTNPICFAAPVQGEDPFCLDMATSGITWNKLMMYKDQSKELMDGWAVDKNGLITTDSKEAVALNSFGGYKGYGLSLMIEIFCSLLTGMPYGINIPKMFPPTKDKRYLGHCFMAININQFQPLEIFKKRMKLLINDLRKIEPIEGVKQVLVPADPEKNALKKRLKNGIPLSPLLIKEIKLLTDYYNIDF